MIEQLKAQEAIGLELRKFIQQTDAGKFLSGVIDQDIQSSKDKFMDLDPYKYTTLQDLQNAILSIQFEARISIALQNIIGVAIVEGDQASHQLSTEAD